MTTKLQDTAVCLRRQDYSETSQIVTLFGREHGKIRAICKGSRRTKAGISRGIDLLTVGDVQFVAARDGSGLATLTEFELVEPFLLLRQQLVGLHCGQYGAELVSRFTEEHDPHPQLYDAMYAFLDRLQVGRDCEALLVRFELATLREAGLAPVWDRCVSCGGAVAGARPVYFSSVNSGILCRDCEPTVLEKRLVEPRVLTIMQSPGSILNAPRVDIVDAHDLLVYHVRELLGKETKIMTFVQRLLRQAVQ